MMGKKFLIQLIFSVYRGLNRGPSEPEADNIPIGHHASMVAEKLSLKLIWGSILYHTPKK